MLPDQSHEIHPSADTNMQMVTFKRILYCGFLLFLLFAGCKYL